MAVSAIRQAPGRSSRVTAPSRSNRAVADSGRRRLRRARLGRRASSRERRAGSGGFGKDVAATTWLRADDVGVKELPKEPRWLEGYRSSTSEEWMGSLLATVDGKDVPLTVGYRKVVVEIRDQIARTTVEESFVNSTDATLEGVFSFPLPADASISVLIARPL